MSLFEYLKYVLSDERGFAQISFSDLVNGVVPDASDFNTRFNALKDRFNNGIDGDNISNNAVTTVKILNGAVTNDKITTVDASKFTGVVATANGGTASALAPNTTGGVVVLNSTYVFVVSGITTVPTASATYTNNGFTYTVTSATASYVYATGTGIPSASGSLSKTGGTGDASIAFSEVKGQVPAVDGSLLTNVVKPTVAFPGNQVYNSTCDQTWRDVDCSAVTGANAAIVFIKCTSSSTFNSGIAVRTNGETLGTMAYATSFANGTVFSESVAGGAAILAVVTDASGIFEVSQRVNSSTATISILAYAKA